MPQPISSDKESRESASASLELLPEREGRAMAVILAEPDRIPDRADASDPMQWDELGLPK